eukprot:75834-Pyramimonas_sp.AAC.1
MHVIAWQASHADAIIQRCGVGQLHHGEIVLQRGGAEQRVRINLLNLQHRLGRICAVLAVAARHDVEGAPALHTVRSRETPPRSDEGAAAEMRARQR